MPQTDTKITNLIINELTQAQYDSATKNQDEFYLITDANVDVLPSQTGQSGKFLTTDGTDASWADIPTEVDNKSVTLNSNDEIQTIGIIDQNNTTKAIKKWTGTKAEYDAIVTKDPDTEYITTDEDETVYQNSYRIGQILPSILPVSDYGLHLLDGAVIAGTGIYSSFYNYITGLVSTYPNLFINEADWQTAVTTYGVCGKFVYDSTNKTIRLPKITGIIEGTTDATALGDLVQAGLPNITGTFTGFSSSTGAISSATSSVGSYNGGGGALRTNTLDASTVSSIYGNSTTVQPQTIKVYYYIVIANSFQTPTGIQISKIVTDLNRKVDLDGSNATFTHIVETYSNGTSWYRVYSDGWCEQGGQVYTGSVVWLRVTFLKPFTNTNYNMQASYLTTTDSFVNSTIGIIKYANTYADMSVYGAAFAASWRACGYIS